jgi:hypothetical protein
LDIASKGGCEKKKKERKENKKTWNRLEISKARNNNLFGYHGGSGYGCVRTTEW